MQNLKPKQGEYVIPEEQLNVTTAWQLDFEI